MKTLLEAYLAQNTDRFNCRWLVKRDPTLWNMIVNATAFLPATALPKQRCWHVLNDVWEIPVCPVDGIQVSWFENRYLTYSSMSAQRRCPLVQAKMTATYETRTGHVGHWSSNPDVRAVIREKRHANPQRGHKHSPEWHAKVKATWDEKLRRTVVDSPGSFKEYRDYVTKLTRRSYRDHLSKIAGGHLPRKRGQYQLDHVFSVFDAWRLGVSAEVVSHFSNLQMLDEKDNIRKHLRSDKSLDQLYCDIVDLVSKC